MYIYPCGTVCVCVKCENYVIRSTTAESLLLYRVTGPFIRIGDVHPYYYIILFILYYGTYICTYNDDTPQVHEDNDDGVDDNRT